MKRNFTPYIYPLFLLLNFQCLFGQKIQLKTIATDTVNSSFLDAVFFQKFHNTEDDAYKEIDSISIRLSEIGFIDNRVEFINKQDSLIIAKFDLGINSNKIRIQFNSATIEHRLIKKLNFEHDATYIYINTNEVSYFLNSIIAELENQGHSFSRASLKNISKSLSGLTAELNVEKSSKRIIDKIIIKGYDNFPKSYLKYYLKLKKGDVFNTEIINEVSNSLQSLGFASEIKPPEILFEKNSTSVYLYIQKNKTNKFDGLIGFNTGDNGKLKFNGYLDLYLSNIFNKGETFSMYWKSNSEDRKKFNVSINIPYLFKTPFSIGTSLNLHKQDSTFLNTKASFGLFYQLNANHQISGNLKTENSNEISNLTIGVEEFNNLFSGASYIYRKPDALRPFQNKALLIINGLWGNRTITSNSIKEKQSKYNITASYLWTFNKNHSIFFKNQSALFISPTYYINELFRVGGISTIRGFKEESIYSSAYSIVNLEYRYHINLTTNIYSISDVGYIQNKEIQYDTTLFGFGLGYTYNTKFGLVDISYAIGKQKNIPIELKNSTFHIKYIQMF